MARRAKLGRHRLWTPHNYGSVPHPEPAVDRDDGAGDVGGVRAGQANYASSKAGLVGLARSLARELGSRGITSNVIAPGFVDSDMTANLSEERKAAIISAVPLGRYAVAAEVAAAVAFLAGPDAGYITGAVIPVDGGLGMGH